ncbi:hypothetical protein KM043_014212 [Ampulex compressa]|nr:hypothetical protein KM043_014212 [Ampulex compressa]
MLTGTIVIHRKSRKYKPVDLDERKKEREGKAGENTSCTRKSKKVLKMKNLEIQKVFMVLGHCVSGTNNLAPKTNFNKEKRKNPKTTKNHYTNPAQEKDHTSLLQE